MNQQQPDLRTNVPSAARPSSRRQVRHARTSTPRQRSTRVPSHGSSAPVIHVDHKAQIVGIELRPVGGIFGRADAVELTPTDRTPVRTVAHRRGHIAPETSLLKDPQFRLLWTTRLLSQMAQGALLYALMILVIDLSNRSFYSSLFVACANVSSIFLSLPAGMVVDNVPRKHVLTMLNAFRFAFMLFLVAAEPTLPSVFAATLAIWVIHQFYAPAEGSLLADMVPPSRYTSAQSLFNFAVTISQGLGLGIMAPFLLRFGGPRVVFALCGAIWLVAGALTLLMRNPATVHHPLERRGFRSSLTAGLRFIRGDAPTFEGILDDVLVSVGMSSLVVIIPFYLERVLGTSKENTVFVFAPAAIGLVIGLRLSPLLSRLIGERVSAFLSVACFAACILGLGFVEQTYRALNDGLHIPLDRLTDRMSISPFILLAMLISIPAGMANSIVNVASRSILLHRTPGAVRGQVIASQGMIGNVIALIPTLLAGVATDVFGVIPVAVGIAVLILIGGLIARHIGRGASPATRRAIPSTA